MNPSELRFLEDTSGLRRLSPLTSSSFEHIPALRVLTPFPLRVFEGLWPTTHFCMIQLPFPRSLGYNRKLSPFPGDTISFWDTLPLSSGRYPPSSRHESYHSSPSSARYLACEVFTTAHLARYIPPLSPFTNGVLCSLTPKDLSPPSDSSPTSTPFLSPTIGLLCSLLLGLIKGLKPSPSSLLLLLDSNVIVTSFSFIFEVASSFSPQFYFPRSHLPHERVRWDRHPSAVFAVSR